MTLLGLLTYPVFFLSLTLYKNSALYKRIWSAFLYFHCHQNALGFLVSQHTNGVHISETPLHNPTGTTWTSPVLGLAAGDLTETPFLMIDPNKAIAQGLRGVLCNQTNYNTTKSLLASSRVPHGNPSQVKRHIMGGKHQENTPCRWVMVAGLQLAGRESKGLPKHTWVGKARGKGGRAQGRSKGNLTARGLGVTFSHCFHYHARLD